MHTLPNRLLSNPATAILAAFVAVGTFVTLPEARVGGGGSTIKGALLGVTPGPALSDAATLHIDLAATPPRLYDLDSESASDFASALADHPRRAVIVELRVSRGLAGMYAPTFAWDTVSVRTRTGLFGDVAPADQAVCLSLAGDWWRAHQANEQEPDRAAEVARRIAAGGSAEFRTLPVGYAQNALALASVCVCAASLLALGQRGLRAIRDRRATRRIAQGRCPACNYPLPGSGRCPECGSGANA